MGRLVNSWIQEIISRQLNSSFRPQRSGEPESKKCLAITVFAHSREWQGNRIQLFFTFAYSIWKQLQYEILLLYVSIDARQSEFGRNLREFEPIGGILRCWSTDSLLWNNFKYFQAPDREGFDYNPRLIKKVVERRPKSIEMGEAEWACLIFAALRRIFFTVPVHSVFLCWILAWIHRIVSIFLNLLPIFQYLAMARPQGFNCTKSAAHFWRPLSLVRYVL